MPYLLEKSHQCSGGYLRNQRRTKRRAFVVDKALGSLPSLSPRDVQTGASVDNGHMLSDGTNHRRILKETEKQSYGWELRGDEQPSRPQECSFGLQVQMSGSSIPGLLIPPLPVPESATIYHII